MEFIEVEERILNAIVNGFELNFDGENKLVLYFHKKKVDVPESSDFEKLLFIKTVIKEIIEGAWAKISKKISDFTLNNRTNFN